MQALQEAVATVTGTQERDEHHTEREGFCVQRLNDPDWRRAHTSHKVPVWMSLLVMQSLRWCVSPGDNGESVHSKCSAESALETLDGLLNALGLTDKEYHPSAADLARWFWEPREESDV